MRKKTYDKLGEYSGYIKTENLLTAGFTNRQIGEFVKEGLLEKICHGHYWVSKNESKKPDEYKAIEVCLSDPRAVVCADSACFYLGLISIEPAPFSVATGRNDRSAMKMNFSIKRHYFSQNIFPDTCYESLSDFGKYNIFDIDRSVCDCILFRKDMDQDIFALIIENYRKTDRGRWKRMEAYAQKARMMNEVKKYFS